MYQAWQENKFTLLCCDLQIEEFTRVISYPKLVKFIKPFEAEQMMQGIKINSKMITDLPEVNYSPDPKDNYLISLAIKGKASHLITGDKRDLLSLKEIEGIKIINVRKFLDLFIH